MVFRFCSLLLIAMLLMGRSWGQDLPNIVIILADDLGYGDPQCYNDSSLIPTPQIDGLAANGIRFTDAHSPASVCTPTRYGILTGRYAWRTALKKSVLWPWDSPLLEDERLTLPDMLSERGYQTACVGKWHLGFTWYDAYGNPVNSLAKQGVNDRQWQMATAEKIDFSMPLKGGPLQHGFDYYFGDDVPNFPPYIFIENNQTLGLPSASKPENIFGHPGPMLPGWDLSTVMPTITQKACAYIDKAVSRNDPFFLYFALTAPHTPIAPSPHFIGRSKAAWYGDYVMEVDWAVGQVVETLKKNKIFENTIVIFTSDNGSPQRDGTDMNGATGSVKKYGHDPSRPWRGMKADIWEGGHRVPFIITWPDRIINPFTSAQPFVLLDLMKSLAAITNSVLPDDAAPDSYDFSSVFLGSIPEKNIRDHMIHHSGQGIFSIRMGDWKLILGKDSGGFTRYTAPDGSPPGQLYNLKVDPQEQTNLYDLEPTIVSELQNRLEREWESDRE